jgi:GntR family transcriptional repressor for pyruvate dehydrogenase complex
VTNDRLVSELTREATLAQRVELELERLIVGSHLGEGDRLPSERELATQFGVSRTVVREAIRALAAKHLVEVGVGRGTVVRVPSAESAAAPMKLLLRMQAGGADLEKVIEVRRVLEVEIAGLAAARRTERDVRELEAVLDRADRHRADADAFIKEDVRFHARLAEATQNELFEMMLASLAEVMTEVRILGLRTPNTATRALGHHQRIFDAVVIGDPEAARAAMQAHMDEASETLRLAVAER